MSATESPQQAERVFRFGPYEVSEREGELRKNAIRMKLQEQPFRVLLELLANAGKVVSREELQQKLWPADTFVDFDIGLNNAIRKLRQALNDDADHPRYIETLPKRGYRFIAPLDDTAPQPVVPSPAVEGDRTSNASGRWIAIVKSKATWLILLAVLVGGAALWKWREAKLQSDTRIIHSIAVLPLLNLSGDPGQEYFADGTTEELITTFARLTDLRVTSRTSAMQFKGVQKSVKQIGQVLGVDAIIEGSIARSGDMVRVTVQLIDAHADRHLWANEYHSNLSDVLHLQEEVAHDVALQVSAKVAPQKGGTIAGAKTVNPQAHDVYLQARQYMAKWNDNDKDVPTAINLYQQALALQPDYAAAYVGLADAYSAYGTWGTSDDAAMWRKVRETASKGLSLDNSVPGAHALLAWVKHIYDWDTVGAEAEFKAALETDRNDANTHATYGLFLAQIGRVEEGLAEAALAEELDPLSSRISGRREKMFMIARRYDDVFKQAKRTRELYPNSMVTTLHILETNELLGRYEEAIDEFEAHPYPGSTQQETAALAKKLRTALRTSGPIGYWEVSLQDRLATQADDHCLLAYVYFRTGEHENGYRHLDLAIQGRDRNLRQMKTHPMWDVARSDPRFQAVLRRVGF